MTIAAPPVPATVRVSLRPRTERILRGIAEHWRERGYAPSIRELTEMAGLTSTSVAQYHLILLRRCGLVHYERLFVSRTARLTEAGRAWLGQESCPRCGGTGTVERE